MHFWIDLASHPPFFLVSRVWCTPVSLHVLYCVRLSVMTKATHHTTGVAEWFGNYYDRGKFLFLAPSDLDTASFSTGSKGPTCSVPDTALMPPMQPGAAKDECPLQ